MYIPTLNYPYVWDDFSLVAHNPYLGSTYWGKYFFSDLGKYNEDPHPMGYWRPLQTLTFGITNSLFGNNPLYHRLINVMLHVLASVSLVLIAFRLTQNAAIAFFSGALFALHPLATEQVIFIANRCGVMEAAFSLLYLASMAAALPESGGIKFRPLGVANIALCLAMMSKVSALMIPLAAVIFAIFSPRERRLSRYEWLKAFTPSAGLMIAYIIFRFWYLGITPISHAASPLWTRLIGVPKILGRYFLLSIAPVQLSVDRFIVMPKSVFDPAVLLSVFLLLGALIWSIACVKKNPGSAFGLVLFGLAAAPVSGIIPLARPFAEHYIYLSLAGFCLVFASIVPFEKAGSKIIIASLCTILAASTLWRQTAWSDELLLWQDAVKKCPQCAHALSNLGAVFLERGKPVEAEQLLLKAVQSDPSNQKTLMNLGIATFMSGKKEDGLKILRQLLQLNPDYERAAIWYGYLSTVNDPSSENILLNDPLGNKELLPAIMLGIALAYKNQNRLDDMARVLKKFNAEFPMHPFAKIAEEEIKRSMR